MEEEHWPEKHGTDASGKVFSKRCNACQDKRSSFQCSADSCRNQKGSPASLCIVPCWKDWHVDKQVRLIVRRRYAREVINKAGDAPDANPENVAAALLQLQNEEDVPLASLAQRRKKKKANKASSRSRSKSPPKESSSKKQPKNRATKKKKR